MNDTTNNIDDGGLEKAYGRTEMWWWIGILGVAALLIALLVGAQLAHREHRERAKWEFPCQEEDEARITFVTPRGNESICAPVDDILVNGKEVGR